MRAVAASRFAALALLAALLALPAAAQDSLLGPSLPPRRFRSGEETLAAFAPISAATRYSIVKLNVDGETVALGAVVETNGLVITKASEIKKGKLTCWLASDKEVPAQLLATDDDEDLALVRVRAQGLKPIQWATGDVALGQWAITPGVAETPQAVGIISAVPHRIRPQRALIGVEFNLSATRPVIERLMPGFGAEKAGLKPGDVIAAVNGVTMTNWGQTMETVREFRVGQTLKLSIERDEEQFDADVRLMPLTAMESAASSYSGRRADRLTGDISRRAEGFEQAIEHDTVLQPWLCGGPLVNLDGQAIGLNIARASRVTTYALPARLVKQVVERLKTSPTPRSSPSR